MGSAAFMQTRGEAEQLAASIADLGADCGTPTQTILSDMNVPLGRSAGNWLEVVESVECLEGGGPDDLRALVVECAAHLLTMTQLAPSMSAAKMSAQRALNDGRARAKWDEMLRAQGADMAAFEAKLKSPPQLACGNVGASKSGVVTKCDARIIAEVARDLGGGRKNKDSVLNLNVGIGGIKNPGERVKQGDVLCDIYAENFADIDSAIRRLGGTNGEGDTEVRAGAFEIA